MTMLDRMRRHRNWLKWSLGIVIAGFVLLYVPSFLRPTGVGAAPNDTLVSVNGYKVTVASYQRVYQAQLQQLQRAYGGQLNEDMIKQFGIGQRILSQLIDEQAVVAEADRLGLSVSDGELRQRIINMPGLQQDGHFIGDAAYRQLLLSQRPPMRPSEFEAQLRHTLVAEKLQGAVTAWINVNDAEADQAYRDRNEKVKLELAIFTANNFRSGITPTDAELASHFEANKDTYKLPEKRRVRFLSVDAEALRASMSVTPQEVEARYNTNRQTYSTPEQVRASHILLKTEGKDETAVRKQAEAILAKAKGGADFAGLAKQFSEDEQSKVQGGDLDYFGRGTMVKEFDEAVWKMQPGQISDLVKSSFGFHIIKLTDKKAASTKTLDEVRAQLEDQIRFEKAQAEATRIASEIAGQIKSPADLDSVARARGLAVGDSGLFSRDEPLAGLGFAPAVSAEAFTQEQGKVSGMLRTNQGYAFITVVEIKPSALPTLDQVKDKVKDDVVRVKAVELARTRAAQMAASAKSNFASAAKAAGVDVKTTDLISRGASLPEVGVNSAVDKAVFALKKGDTSAPIATDNAVVVARVVERTDVTPEAVTAGRTAIKEELVQQKRGEFFSAYMAKAKEKMTFTNNDAAIRTVLGMK